MASNRNGKLSLRQSTSNSRRNTIESSGDTQYALKDSEGNTLTPEQQEFFKDSKVRDENGNLLVVYHGSKNKGFNIFDISRYGESGKPELMATKLQKQTNLIIILTFWLNTKIIFMVMN